MPNEFQRVMDSMLGSIPFTNCYLDDILIASKGTFLDHKKIVLKIFYRHWSSITSRSNGQNVNSFKKK